VDSTIPFDDMLVERWHTCLLCGAVARQMALLEVVGQVWLGCLCARCLSTDGWPAVERLLAQRSHDLQSATKDRKF
jgi:hypothetical protein